MDIKREYSRMVQHRWGTTGSVATIPATEEMSIDWLETDLNVGEIGINRVDDRAFFRTDNGIIEFTTGGTESTIWVDTGSTIDLGATHSGKPVLPATDDTSDLGSSSLRWKDLYLGSRIDVSTHATFSVIGADTFIFDGDGIILESEKTLSTSNGNGKLELDADGDPDLVRLSNDGGDESGEFIKLESGDVNIKSTGIITLDGVPRMSSLGGGTGVSVLSVDAFDNVVASELPNSLIISDTRANVITLRDAGNLIPGVYYYLTDKQMWFQALTDSLLSTSGKVNQSIVSNTAYVVTGIIKGVWYSTISVSIGDVVVWGASTWENQTGAAGSSIDNYNLDSTNWLPVSGYNENKIFDIDYLIDDDIVTKQSDDRGNVLNITLSSGGAYLIEPIISDWGDEKIKNNISAYILNNSGPGVVQNNITKYGIYNNLNTNGIYNNDITGAIYNNDITGVIYDNSNIGSINDNSNIGSIFNNSNKGGVFNNSNNSINDNSNTGNINDNSNTGNINYNSNTGNINDNSNTGEISYNSNYNNINDNSHSGIISNNDNRGSISNNISSSGTMDIAQNLNNGEITYNRNTASIVIQNNINNGHIGVPGGGYTTRGASVGDTIVNK